MRTPRFFQPSSLSAETEIDLDDNAVQHIARALRMREGEAIELFCGDGYRYPATLVSVEKRKVRARIDAQIPSASESPLKISIGQSISRGERMDYAVQKATETGMFEMTPLLSERCEVKLNAERQQKRQRHWQQIAISACEQSGRCAVPEINEISSLQDWCSNVEADLKLVLHHHTEAPLAALDFTPSSVALLIGPEGGLTESEVEQALAAGFKPLALGPRVMRTETAPVAAQSILHYLWGDMAAQP